MAQRKPTISNFKATPSSISVGQSSTLSATVKNASTLTLDGANVVLPTTVAPAVTHTYTLKATNNAGSATASTTVTVQAAAPSVVITTPANGATLTGTVTVSASATAAAGIASIVIYVNGVQLGTSTSSPASFSLNTTLYSNGSVTLSATVTDALGVTASTSISCTVSNTAPPTGTTYYVSSSTGSDSNAGTLTAPWQTLAKVYAMRSAFNPGDSILLKRGDTWNETFNIDSKSGSSGLPIVYGAYGTGALPIIDAQNTRTFGLYMDNVSWITVQDMHFVNATADGFHITANTGVVTNITTYRLQADHNTRHGFYCEANTGKYVDVLQHLYAFSTLNGQTGFHNFECAPPTGIDYYYCKATYNGQAAASHGFSSYRNSAGANQNVRFHYCESAYENIDPNTGLPNAFTTEGHGFAFDDFSSGCTAEFCYSHDNQGWGIAAAHQANNNVVTYNVVANNLGGGIIVNGDAGGSANTRIANNTVVGNAIHGIQVLHTASGTVLQNNIVSTNTGYGIAFEASGVTSSTVATNIVYGNVAGSTINVTATGTITSNPSLIGGTNYALLAGSPAINAGLNLGATYQMALVPGSTWPSAVSTANQNSYGTGWEIGAFVFVQ